MRPIYLTRLDKARPALVLTRQLVLPRLRVVTVAPITSRVRGLDSELPVGPRNGLDHESVVSLDNVTTIPPEDLIRWMGALQDDQEFALARALHLAYDLEGGLPEPDVRAFSTSARVRT